MSPSKRAPVFSFNEEAKVADIFRSYRGADLQSLGGKDDIGIERFRISRWGPSVAGFRPQLSGLAHCFCVDGEVIEKRFEMVESAQTFAEPCPN